MGVPRANNNKVVMAASCSVKAMAGSSATMSSAEVGAADSAPCVEKCKNCVAKGSQFDRNPTDWKVQLCLRGRFAEFQRHAIGFADSDHLRLQLLVIAACLKGWR